jgi:hypothetical protein
VGLPDGSVAMTREDLAKYHEEQFQKKYAPQDITPSEATGTTQPTPEAPAAAAAAIPTQPNTYAAAVKESEYLKRQPKTTAVKARLAELEQFKQQFVQDRLAAAQQPVSPESQAIREQMESGQVTPANIVSEVDFKAMGVGSTNKKLREAILGKDLNDPAQVAEVKSKLEDYANNPNRSGKIIAAVEEFLNRPEFNVPAETAVPKAEEVIQPEAQATEAPVEQPAPTEQPAVEPTPAEQPAVEPTTPVAEAAPTDQPAPAEDLEASPADQAAAFIKKTRKKKAAPAVAEAPVEETPVEETPLGETTPEDNVGVGQAVARLMQTAKIDREYATRVIKAIATADNEVTPHELDRVLKSMSGKTKYREATAGTKGMPQNKVQHIVDQIRKTWTNAPKIEVVQSISELPADMRDQIIADKVNPMGAFDPKTDTVYLVADNLKDGVAVAMTLAHEALGHYGLRALLGSKFNGMMGDIFAKNAAVQKRALPKMATGLDKETAVEEVLAEMLAANYFLKNVCVNTVLRMYIIYLRYHRYANNLCECFFKFI